MNEFTNFVLVGLLWKMSMKPPKN